MTNEESNERSVLGYNLRRLRRARDLSQKQLADLAGVHSNTVVRAELGDQDPRWSAVEKLANALKVPTTEFSKPVRDPDASDP